MNVLGGIKWSNNEGRNLYVKKCLYKRHHLHFSDLLYAFPMLSCYGSDETGILFQQMYPNGSEVVYRIIRISPDPEKEEEVLIEYIRGMLGGG